MPSCNFISPVRALQLLAAGLAATSISPAVWAQAPGATYGVAPALDESCGSGNDLACGCGKQHALRARAAMGFPIGEVSPGVVYSSREDFNATDLLSCDLDFEINPTNQNITGVNIMRVRSRVNGLSQFTVMLRTNFTVTGATVNGVAVTVPLPPTGSYARVITLPRTFNINEEFTLRIPYSGIAVSRGFGSIEFRTQPGTTNPIVASLSEAYFAATWWPVKDGDVFLPGDNSDKFTMRMAITAPANLTSVANGPRESVSTLSGNRRKFTYSSQYPISTYLVAFASSVYNTWSVNYNYTPDEGGAPRTMPVNFYIYPGSDTPGNRGAWEAVVPMLTTFQPLFGLYPFAEEQYGIYQFPFGGGMEHQTISGQGTFDEGVTAHELAHQWWGDNVTNKTWNHIWLNEGFATYSECLWYQYKPGSSGFPALQAAINNRKPTNPADSVYVTNAGDMNRIFSSAYSYRKGAWVLHQLRRIVGDVNFFGGLREYRAQFEGSAATTEDFTNVMSAVSGMDLTNYFEQAVYGVGAPDYSVGFSPVVLAGQHFAKVSIRQTHNPAWPGRGTPGDAYALPVDLRLTTGAGTVDRTVHNAARTQHYLLPLPAAATSIALDPDGWILAYARAVESYVSGPAKVAVVAPQPGAVLSQPPESVVVTFSENVSIPAGAFLLRDAGQEVISGSFVYSGQTATFTPTLALEAGVYTVSINANVTTTVGNIALDGESGSGVLPSGDGLPGGSFVMTFTVEGSCIADFNQDGGVDGSDVESFFIAWAQADGSADANADGGVDGADVESFFLAWSAGAC
jgi:aminopeptidase N